MRLKQTETEFFYISLNFPPSHSLSGYGYYIFSSFKAGPVRINVWITTGTVSTSLDHPKAGKTQLFRKNGPDYEMLDRIFENPRVHSGSGYREKKKKEQVRVIYLQYFHIFSIKFRRRFVKDFPQSLTSKIKYKCNRCGKTLIYF